MLFNIKARIITLGKRLVDLIPELAKRGIIVSAPSHLSNALNGKDTTPKAKEIVRVSNEIITAWEKGTEG